MASADPDEVNEGLRIADVSDALGVPIPTLRSWELRYGIPHPMRTAGRHRRYRDEDINQLRLMRDEIARGMRAGEAATSVHQLLDRSGAEAEFVTAMLAASNRADADGIRAALSGALHRLGLAACLDEVLLPSMRQIGTWWETGVCDVGQEKFTTAATRSWLEDTSSSAPPPQNPSAILLCTGPGDLHTVGLEAFATLMRFRGWRCAAAAEAPTSAALPGAAAIIVVSHLPSARRRAIARIAEFSATGLPVYYAGNAFARPDSRRTALGTYLGDNLERAARRLDADLSNRPHRPRPSARQLSVP